MNFYKFNSNILPILVFIFISNITNITKADSEHLRNDLKLENNDATSTFEDKAKIEKLFFKYANNNDTMSSTQMNKFIDHLIDIFGDFYDHEHGSVPDDTDEHDSHEDGKSHGHLGDEHDHHDHQHEKKEDKQITLNSKQSNGKEHSHSDDHDHDHDHDHEENNVDNSKNPKIKCLKERLSKLKSNSPNLNLNKTGFVMLSSSILANMADCVCINLTKNETIQSTSSKLIYNPKSILK
jgi:hypothetical protein